jgi:surface antigen
MRLAMRIALFIMLAVLPVCLAGCGCLRGWVSDRFASGAVIGGIMDSRIGRDMDERERRIAANAEYRALEYGQPGQPTAWDDSVTGHHGSIVPGPAYNRNTYYCRAYTHTIYRDGSSIASKGAAACRGPDGLWRSVYCLNSTHIIYRHGFPLTSKITTCRELNRAWIAARRSSRQ